MRNFAEPVWLALLGFVPTYALQLAMVGRRGVDAQFILPGQAKTVTAKGACWLTVNED